MSANDHGGGHCYAATLRFGSWALERRDASCDSSGLERLRSVQLGTSEVESRSTCFDDQTWRVQRSAWFDDWALEVQRSTCVEDWGAVCSSRLGCRTRPAGRRRHALELGESGGACAAGDLVEARPLSEESLGGRPAASGDRRDASPRWCAVHVYENLGRSTRPRRSQ